MSDERVHVAAGSVAGIAKVNEEPPASADEASPPEFLARHAFSVGGLNLLVGEDAVCEVMDVPPIARIPHTAPWFLGLANLRGEVVPVFDLAQVLGRGTGRKSVDRLLVIERGETAAGVLIEELPALQRFAPADRAESAASLPPLLESCVTDCFARDGKEWIEFAHERLFETIAADVPLR